MIKTTNIVKALRALVAEGGAPNEVAQRFALFVERRGLTMRVPHILEMLARVNVYDRSERMLTIHAASAPTKEVIAAIKKRLHVEDDVEVEVIEDESVIGGVRAAYADRYLDGSIARQIARVREAINNA